MDYVSKLSLKKIKKSYRIPKGQRVIHSVENIHGIIK